MNVLISIIVPYYNSVKYLEELLESISRDPDIEVIVVDDHSDKGIAEFKQLQKKYENTNISFYENDADKKGAGTARNKGLSLAKGEYLLFADADDTFLPGIWDILKKQEFESDIVFFPPTSQKKDGSIGNRHEHYSNLVKAYADDRSLKNETRLRWQYWSPCSKLVKRELTEKYSIRFEETLVSNDMMFSTLIGLYAKTTDAIDLEIYQIREHDEGLTRQVDTRSKMTRKKVFCDCYKIMKQNTTRKERMNYLGYGLGSEIYYLKWRTMCSVYDLFRKGCPEK